MVRNKTHPVGIRTPNARTLKGSRQNNVRDFTILGLFHIDCIRCLGWADGGLLSKWLGTARGPF